jgi:hypothetical protein
MEETLPVERLEGCLVGHVHLLAVHRDRWIVGIQGTRRGASRDSMPDVRRALGALLAAVLPLAGCATPLIRDSRIQPDRYEAVLERTAARWGAALREPVPSQVIGRDDVGPLLRGLVADQMDAEELRAYQEGLISVGLWPADRDLVDEQVALSRQEVAGLYAPTRRRLYVVRDQTVPFSLRIFSTLSRRDLFWETILAHELVHALQHQHRPELMEALLWRGQDDAVSAVSIAIEGDAMRYGLEALDLPVVAPEVLRQDMQRSDEEGALASAPALLRLTLLVPYVEGYRLSYSEGPALRDAPPASTEQALHPERRREPFLSFDLAPLVPSLPGGCRFVDENGMGELGISVLLRDLSNETIPAGAWQGWDGDRYLAARCGEERAFVWISAWDSEADALEFESAYREIAAAVAARAGMRAAPGVRRRGREVHVVSEELAALAEPLETGPRRSAVASLAELAARVAEAERAVPPR